MFRRKPTTIRQKVMTHGDDLGQAAATRLRKLAEPAPRKLDRYAAGALLVGLGNWVSMSLFNFDAVKAVAGRKSVSGRTAYGVLSLSALYGAVRGAQRASR